MDLSLPAVDDDRIQVVPKQHRLHPRRTVMAYRPPNTIEARLVSCSTLDVTFAGCYGHEDRIAVNNSTAEDDMKDATSDLARASDLPRHKL